MPTSVCPSGRLEPPFTKRGRRRSSYTPWPQRRAPTRRKDAFAACRGWARRGCGGRLTPHGLNGELPHGAKMLLPPVGAGRELVPPGGCRCLVAQVTRARGGSRWAVPKSSCDGMGIATSRPAPRPRLLPALPSLQSLALRSDCSDHVHLMMRGVPLAPVVAHIMGPRVGWHLETKAKYWGQH